MASSDARAVSAWGRGVNLRRDEYFTEKQRAANGGAGAARGLDSGKRRGRLPCRGKPRGVDCAYRCCCSRHGRGVRSVSTVCGKCKQELHDNSEATTFPTFSCDRLCANVQCVSVLAGESNDERSGVQSSDWQARFFRSVSSCCENLLFSLSLIICAGRQSRCRCCRRGARMQTP